MTTAATLAGWLNETNLATAYAVNASAFKPVYNAYFWLPSAGQYRDNASTTLCPQDANAMALLFGLTNDTEQALSVSRGLRTNGNACVSSWPGPG